MSSLICLLLITIGVLSEGTAERQIVSVKTDIGLINGFVEEVTFMDKSAKVNKFLGIPFAEPPIGELRFEKPVAKATLVEHLDAFSHGNACWQPILGYYNDGNVAFSEDCLYLNVYVPERLNKNEKLPVMVWIYGGGFNIGFADIYTSENLAVQGEVIVVTLNYRVSLFGFLTSEDENAPGNYGLWDQHLAIRWVHDNIGAFGGDPGRVTLFGESAGSASTVFQALYPGNKGLFQRIIGQSGSVGAWWGTSRSGLRNAKSLASLAECNTENNEAMVSCLKKASAEKLIEFASNATYGFMKLPFPFLPRQDGDFVTYDLDNALDNTYSLSQESRDMISSLDIIMGVTSGEGSLAVNPFLGVSDPENFLPNRTYFETVLVPLAAKTIFSKSVPKAVEDAIIAEYTNWDDPDNEYNVREEYCSLFGDFSFLGQLYRTLDRHTEVTSSTKSYMYVFEDEPETRFYTPTSWFKKLPHGGDLLFVFGFRNADAVNEHYKFSPTQWELRLASDVMTIWANFAKSGNPNYPNDLGLDWLPYTKQHQHFLQISRDMTSSNVKQRWNLRRANFLTKFLPSLLRRTTDGNAYSESHNTETCTKDSCSP